MLFLLVWNIWYENKNFMGKNVNYLSFLEKILKEYFKRLLSFLLNFIRIEVIEFW